LPNTKSILGNEPFFLNEGVFCADHKKHPLILF
jgi:hypothetical protein